MTRKINRDWYPYVPAIEAAMDRIIEHPKASAETIEFVKSVQDFGMRAGGITKKQMSAIGKVHKYLVCDNEYRDMDWWDGRYEQAAHEEYEATR